MRINRSHHSIVSDEPAPDRNDEYHFYQALLAIWPPEAEDALIPARAADSLVDRLQAYMLKAIREAKVHTSWVNPNGPYEAAVERFVERTLGGVGAARFLPAFVPFARRVARLGAINALAQLVLKVASPGIPDIYQGSELWDLTLVDPDNRQAVDYDARKSALEQLEPLLARTSVDVSGAEDAAIGGAVRALLSDWPDGRIKLYLTALGLRWRRAKPRLFLSGSYTPLDVEGWRSDHILAFAREHGSDLLVAVVPRLGALLGGDISRWPMDTTVWGDTRIRLRPEWSGRVFKHLVTGEPVRPVRTTTDDWITAAQIFDHFPVALLWTSPSGDTIAG
jgi:(1->4)-alpha-D-glucan 1-alpha-D-glucosylmutase